MKKTAISGKISADAELLVQAMFEAQVLKSPDAIAVVQKEQQWSYKQLNHNANQLAHYLRKMGAKPEVRVAICLERSMEMVVALMGILKSGAAYLPLDPAYPNERLNMILEDSGASLLVTERKFFSQFREWSGDIILLDADTSKISQESRENPPTSSSDLNLSYVIYTSGSTGIPKGVMISHGSLAEFVSSAIDTYEIQAMDRVLQFASISFDTAAEEIFPSLCTGSTVVLRSENMLDSELGFLKKCDEWGITVLDLPTAYWHHIVTKMAVERLRLPDRIRLVIIGGERAQADRLADWYRVVSEDVQLINTYGPTEATVVATAANLTSIRQSSAKLMDPPIGRPIDHVQTYVLDSDLETVSTGLQGELHIGGSGLARGYLNRPELTSEKFIPDPFSNEPGARLYKTGDRARILPDGNLEFNGRVDDQIKLRGFRIELGEIEAILREHKSVKDCVVLLRENEVGEGYLTAYIVLASHLAPDHSELRFFLKRRLPAFMIPSFFVELSGLPITPSGKIDRASLPAPEKTRTMRETLELPRTPLERVLTALWSEVLRLDQIGLNDNFFDLGGHSLAATQLLSRIRLIFQLDISMKKLFEFPTVGSLAEYIKQECPEPSKLEKIAQIFVEVAELPEDEARKILSERTESASGEKSLEVLPILSAEKYALLELLLAPESLSISSPTRMISRKERIAPELSYGIWIAEQKDPGLSVYHIPEAIRIIGSLDSAALQKSVDEIVRRHEALRTTFLNEDGKPIQEVASEVKVEIQIEDLQNVKQQEKEKLTKDLLHESANTPFDLSKGPLLRFLLLRLEEDDHIFLMTIHHIISDGWSIDILMRELAMLYGSYSKDESSALSGPLFQYSDFKNWQKQWLQGDVLNSEFSYWKKKLNGMTAMELSLDYPRPPKLSFRGTIHSFVIPPALTQSLKALSRSENVTLFMLLLAAFKVLLSRYTGQEDIAVDSPVAGRNRYEAENIVGCLTNTLILRTNVSGNPSFQELLQQVRQVALEAYAHQDIPIEILLSKLTKELIRPPLYEVMFVLQNTPMVAKWPKRLKVTPYTVDKDTSMFDLTLEIADDKTGLRAFIEYSTDLFHVETIQKMSQHYQNILQAIVVNPGVKVSEIPILSGEDRDQILFQWNNTSERYIEDLCVHQLFEQQVEKTPDAVAIESDQDRISYYELNRRANQLAHYLSRSGVCAEKIVGIYMNRSIEMIVSILGVLKAGGAYLPLDPGYPKEQVGFILKDSKCYLLLTHESLQDREVEPEVVKLYLDANFTLIANEPFVNLNCNVAPANLAYLIYTSGSTGKPKGVLIAHNALLSHSTAIRKQYASSPADRVLHFAAVNFDVAAEELFPSLISGATVVLRSEEVVLSLEKFNQFLRQEKISVVNLPTSFWQEWVSYLRESPDQIPGDLRMVVVGTESGSMSRFQEWKALVGESVEWRNAYGLTETTITSTIFDPRMCSPYEILHSIPIGRPIANTETYLLDTEFQPVPVGVRGELFLSGLGLSRGYLNHMDTTAERFIPNPFSQEPGARMFKTGDFARYLSDGTIELLGRVDYQAKIRGYRIELGEIEAALHGHPNVRAAAVIVQEHSWNDKKDKKLVAYFVSAQSPVPANGELRRYLEERLPYYMIPNRFVCVDALPLLPSGKVNRDALHYLEEVRSEQSAEFLGPRNPVESILAMIWTELLGIEQIGMEENFFDLGGHSLIATQMVSRLRKVLQIELPVRSIFEMPTISDMAEFLRADKGIGARIEKTAQLLLNVAELSEEEADKMLMDKVLQSET